MECLPRFTFGAFESTAHIQRALPSLGDIAADFGGGFFRPLIVCDENTGALADRLCGGAAVPRCVLPSGEAHKNWGAAEAVLRAACGAGLGRDGVIIGVGGGVIGDLAAFAASVYMRGCGLALVSTTLLGMVDASLGGKTGFDLFGIKNAAGTFYPARQVYMPLESLATLPPAEWKSGMAELIKTAVLESDDFLEELAAHAGGGLAAWTHDTEGLARCVRRAALFKGRIVEADPRETGNTRVLLNLGHTFGHALEAAAGLGTLSHGEAVAWGMVRSCELGCALGITPPARAKSIRSLLAAYGYETAAPHPLGETEAFMRALGGDKKKRGGTPAFVIPTEQGARLVSEGFDLNMIKNCINGVLSF